MKRKELTPKNATNGSPTSENGAQLDIGRRRAGKLGKKDFQRSGTIPRARIEFKHYM
jgi:hypothetical protein